MRILTLTQPWATLVALGHKKVETRSWSTPYRGSMAIHAAKGWKPENAEWATELVERGLIPSTLPFGQIVCVVHLKDVLPTNPPTWHADQVLEMHKWFMPDEKEREFGNYDPGRYAWLMEDLRPIPPMKFKGAQGLRNLPLDVESLILGHLQLS